jgi:hypothetical protein
VSPTPTRRAASSEPESLQLGFRIPNSAFRIKTSVKLTARKILFTNRLSGAILFIRCAKQRLPIAKHRKHPAFRRFLEIGSQH